MIIFNIRLPAPLQFKTLRVEEYRLALRNLELHYQDFLRDSQDSQMFGVEDRMQVESNYNKANQHYNTMVSSAEQGACHASGSLLLAAKAPESPVCLFFSLHT